MYEHIRYEVKDPVATITLSRPERLNALTARMLAELRHALAAAEADRSVVGIVLTGAGRGFSAGMDAQALAATAAGSRAPQDEIPAEITEAAPGDPGMGPDFQVTFGYLLSIQKPLIAAVNGPAAGLSMVIACLCDLRFAAESAAFRIAFPQRGLVAEHGISWILPRLVGPARALDILWHPRKIDAKEALALGLVNRVVPDAKLLAECRSYIEELAAQCSPASLRIIKQQVYRHLNASLERAMQETNRLMDESLRRGDFKEGITSFVERRPPKFDRVGSA